MRQLTLLDIPVRTGVVYYATDLCNIKIGRTNNPRRRGGELKVTSLLTFPGGETEERRHHRMWARYRIGSSEWFRPADELLLWLATAILDGSSSAEAKTLVHLVRGLKRAVAA